MTERPSKKTGVGNKPQALEAGGDDPFDTKHNADIANEAIGPNLIPAIAARTADLAVALRDLADIIDSTHLPDEDEMVPVGPGAWDACRDGVMA